MEMERKKTAIGVVREMHLAGKPESDAMIIKRTAEILREKHGFDVELKAPNQETANYLKKMGFKISTLTGFERVNAIFSMARGEEVNQKIKVIKARGAISINEPTAILESMNRWISHTRLTEANINTPPTEIKLIDEIGHEAKPKKIILKRIDRHECITAVDANEPLHKILLSYARKGYHDPNTKPPTLKEGGVDHLLVQDWVHGDHIKYYAVGDKVWLTETEIPDKKLSDQIKESIRKTGKAIGLDVYGGDMMIDKDNNVFMVDTNDWPSFSAVREEAADKIADLIASKVKK